MATAPDLHEPQIAAARAQAWHQAGDALVTLESARTWLNAHGLVLFAPRPALGAPAPSLVEATLGSQKESTTPADAGTARTLVARLVGEGSAVALNLLGGPGDLPDFVVSAAAFPFVFTLRGDKGWKRPPETTGAVKVSPLALRVYELLGERGALPVAEIASEIGREVNESGVSRALSELWQLLRVLPVLQQGEGETRWELTTARFLKAVKAGANAGQPTALSALISLYLSQALIATEEQVAGFLSPLTARSRVRDVLHGLSAGRQLAEGVLNGKIVLFVPDALPDFAQFAPPVPETVEADAGDVPVDEAAQRNESQPRIRRFGAKDGAAAGAGETRNLRGKPVRAGTTGPARDRSRRPPAVGRGEGRPFTPRGERGSGGTGPTRAPRGDRPSFARPPVEGRAGRSMQRDSGGEGPRAFPARADGPARPPREKRAGDEGRSFKGRPPGDRPFRERGKDAAPRPARGESRPPFQAPMAGDRPSFVRRASRTGPGEGVGRERVGERGEDRRPAPRGDRPPRPFRPRTEEGGPPKRPYRPRAEAGPRQGGFPERGPAERGFPERGAPGRGFPERGAPGRGFPERGSGGRPFRPRPSPADGERGPRNRPGAGQRPFGPRPSRPRDGEGASGRGPGRPAFPRAAGPRAGADRPTRTGPRAGGDRPARPAFPRAAGDRPAGGGFAPRSRPGERKGGPAGGFRGRPGGKPPGGSARPERPARPPRAPRPEDEA